MWPGCWPREVLARSVSLSHGRLPAVQDGHRAAQERSGSLPIVTRTRCQEATHNTSTLEGPPDRGDKGGRPTSEKSCYSEGVHFIASRWSVHCGRRVHTQVSTVRQRSDALSSGALDRLRTMAFGLSTQRTGCLGRLHVPGACCTPCPAACAIPRARSSGDVCLTGTHTGSTLASRAAHHRARHV